TTPRTATKSITGRSGANSLGARHPLRRGCRRDAALGAGARRPASELHHLVIDVVAAIGAAEIGDAGARTPIPRDLLLALAELGLIGWNGAAAAEPDAGDPAQRRRAGDLTQRPVDPVHLLRDLLEHQQVACKNREQSRPDQMAQHGDIEGRTR